MRVGIMLMVILAACALFGMTVHLDDVMNQCARCHYESR